MEYGKKMFDGQQTNEFNDGDASQNVNLANAYAALNCGYNGSSGVGLGFFQK